MIPTKSLINIYTGRALREIRYYQRPQYAGIARLIQRAPFERLIRGILQEVTADSPARSRPSRMTQSAIQAIQEITEAVIVKEFQCSTTL